MPILHLPGEIIPGQFGPMRRVFFIAQKFFDRDHIGYGNAFGDANDERQTGIGGFHNRVRRKRWRNVNYRNIRAGFFNRVGDGVENRHIFVRRAAFRGRYAANDLRAVFNHLVRVKSSFFSRDALHNQARIFVN
jgi:hypothetical protein